MGSKLIHPNAKAERGHHSVALYRTSMFACGAWAGRWLPLSVTRALAGLAGRLYAFTHASRVARVRQNLQLLDASITGKTARQLYGEFGKTLADYFYIGTRPPAEAVKLIREKTGYHHFEQLRGDGTGAVIVTGHLGLFELGGLLTAHQGFSAAVLTLPEPSDSLTAWRAHFRRQWNVETIEVGSGSFAFIHIARRLREGCLVAALIDRPGSAESSPVIFPNGTSGFSSGILLVAEQCRVPVIPAAMVRQPDGFYRAEAFPPIWIESRGSRAETLRFYSQQIADRLMPTLCAHPEQWYQFGPLN